MSEVDEVDEVAVTALIARTDGVWGLALSPAAAMLLP
tara:strand:+ start:172 stop:282 length:111 start_codon:yes stop_codon:yes gene_type:complete